MSKVRYMVKFVVEAESTMQALQRAEAILNRRDDVLVDCDVELLLGNDGSGHTAPSPVGDHPTWHDDEPHDAGPISVDVPIVSHAPNILAEQLIAVLSRLRPEATVRVAIPQGRWIAILPIQQVRIKPDNTDAFIVVKSEPEDGKDRPSA